jgi:FlaG/FlaF family flagellin (archaellin)
MHAVIRTYGGQGTTELFEALGQHEDEVKELISGVPGFVSYAAFMVGDTGVTVTVCEEKEGTDESSKRAGEWVKENVDATVDAPDITEGDTVLQF